MDEPVLHFLLRQRRRVTIRASGSAIASGRNWTPGSTAGIGGALVLDNPPSTARSSPLSHGDADPDHVAARRLRILLQAPYRGVELQGGDEVWALARHPRGRLDRARATGRCWLRHPVEVASRPSPILPSVALVAYPVK